MLRDVGTSLSEEALLRRRTRPEGGSTDLERRLDAVRLHFDAASFLTRPSVFNRT
jgi:hypothetical protein